MRSGKLVLAGIAAFSLFIACYPSASGAAGFVGIGMAQGRLISASTGRLERVVFHAHSRRNTSYYCYSRNYWWFYRPYTTAQEGYGRCMPYFHYPPQSYGRGAPKVGK